MYSSGPVDNPEEIDLDMGDEGEMDEDMIPDDVRQVLPNRTPEDDALFSPVEISTYSTEDAAAAARSASLTSGGQNPGDAT